jgi:SAM-dependent methyltransferase
MSDEDDPPAGTDDPFAADVEIKSFKDYRKLIKPHSAKTLHSLYDDEYFRKHVGSKSHAERYFSTKGLGATEFTEKPLELAAVGCDDRVLDIGCGRGEMVFQSAALGATAVGIDYSEAALAIAETTLQAHDDSIRERASFVAGNAEAIPFPDGTFDKAFLLDVVEHLSTEELLSVLPEVRRVLKSGGILVIHTPNAWTNTVGYGLRSAVSFVRRRPRPQHPVVEWAAALERDPDYDKRKVLLHVHELSAPALKLALSRSGFRSRVWVDELPHRFAAGSGSRARAVSRAIDVLGFRYAFGRELYAVARKK